MYTKTAERKENVMFETLVSGYESVLHYIAEITVYTLELIGIFIVILGSAKAIIQAFRAARNKESQNLVITLGKALALALEFKMGAEIINTVIIRDLRELAVLAVIIALRAILALLIHWEIKNEKNDDHHTPDKNTSTNSED